MQKLSWYENYQIGRRVGGALILSGLAIVGLALIKVNRGIPPSLLVSVGSLGSIGGLFLWNKSYLMDPSYRLKIMEDFRKMSFTNSIHNHGWKEILDVIPLADIQAHVISEIGDNPNLQTIWKLYKQNIILDCLKHGIIQRELIHDLCYIEIQNIGFKKMHSTYGTWWLDEGILKPEEIKIPFMEFFDNINQEDIISFFKDYMTWPILKFKTSLGFDRNLDEFYILNQIYENYCQAIKSFNDQKVKIQSEFDLAKNAYEREHKLAYARALEQKKNKEQNLLKGENSKKLSILESDWELEKLELENQKEIKLLPAVTKKNSDLANLDTRLDEIKISINRNWFNYKKGIPLIPINTSFSLNGSPNVTVVIQTPPTMSQSYSYPTPQPPSGY